MQGAIGEFPIIYLKNRRTDKRIYGCADDGRTKQYVEEASRPAKIIFFAKPEFRIRWKKNK